MIVIMRLLLIFVLSFFFTPLFAAQAIEDEANLNPAVVDGSDMLLRKSPFSFFPSHAGAYFEVHAGAVYRDWERFASNTVFSTSTSTNIKHGENGATFGGVLGFQYSDHFSFETGAFGLPTARSTNSSLEVENQESWMMYLAAKWTQPLMKNLYWFGKLGYAYTHNEMKNAVSAGNGNVTPSSGGEAKSRYMSIMPATGFQYYLTPKWSVLTQAMYLPGYSHTPSQNYTVPDAYFFTFAISYKYLI